MRNVRRFTLCALILILALALAACSCAPNNGASSGGASSSLTSSSATSSAPTEAPTDTPTPEDSESGSDGMIEPEQGSPEDEDGFESYTDSDSSNNSGADSGGTNGTDGNGSADSSVGQAQVGHTPAGETDTPAGAPSTYELVALTASGMDEAALEALDNRRQNWGPGKQPDANGQPAECSRCNGLYAKYGAIFANPPGKTVTLTFDLGYEAGYTDSILDTLKEKNVQAVFFLTGDYLRAEPEIVQRILDEGHVLGNHTVKHRIQPELSVAEAAAEITALHDEVAATYKYEMTLFRPPEGAFSQRSLAIAQALGYRSVFWSFAYVDWKLDAQPDPIDAVSLLENALHPGAIYLLHAVSSTNDAVLPSFIDSAREAGYAFTATF